MSKEKADEKKVFDKAKKILTYEYFGGKCEEILKEHEDIRKIEQEVYKRKVDLKKSIKENLALSSRLGRVIPAEERKLFKNSLKQVKGVRKLTLNPGTKMTRYLLGDSNDVVMSGGQDQRHQYKTEYENMKFSLTIINIIFTILLLFLPQSDMLDVIYRLFFFYCYVTLILREDILRANGSRIGRWWSIHHYISCLLAVITLTWGTEHDLYQKYKVWFLLFNLYNCVIQIFQFYYQMRRLYVAMSMGEANTVDVINSETTSALQIEKEGMGFLMVLLPLITIDITIIGVLGVLCLMDVIRGDVKFSWQASVVSVLFVILCLGNFFSLLKVIVKKYPIMLSFFGFLKKRKKDKKK